MTKTRLYLSICAVAVPAILVSIAVYSYFAFKQLQSPESSVQASLAVNNSPTVFTDKVSSLVLPAVASQRSLVVGGLLLTFFVVLVFAAILVYVYSGQDVETKEDVITQADSDLKGPASQKLMDGTLPVL